MFEFFISGGGLLFLIFSVYSLLNTQGNILLNRLFGLALFARFCQILTYYSTLVGDINTLYFLYPLNNNMQVLSPIFFFLYIQSFIFDRNKLKPAQIFHFIPFVFLAWDSFLWFSMPTVEARNIVQGFIERRQFFATQPYSILPEEWQYPIRRGFNLLYTIVCWVLIVRQTRNYVWGVQKRWIYFLVSTMTANQILLAVQYLIIIQSDAVSQDLFLAPFQLLLMMILFGVLFYDPRLLYGQLLVSDRWRKPVHLEDLNMAASQPEQKQQENVRRSPVDQEKIQHYIDTMIELMDRKKPFLNPEYQISGLSSDLGIPVHHCSYVLNYHMGKGFRDWINGYRVNYFLQQIPKQGTTKTIEAIAMESGFKNNTTFYNAFKKEKGVLPGDYIKDRT